MATKEEVIKDLLDKAAQADSQDTFEDFCSRIERLQSIDLSS
jgi:hypothetical protein